MTRIFPVALKRKTQGNISKRTLYMTWNKRWMFSVAPTKCMYKFGGRYRRGGTPQAQPVSRRTRLLFIIRTYLNGVTMTIYLSVAIAQRFAMAMVANCHAIMPRRTLSQAKVVSQKNATGKKQTAKDKSAAASDRINQSCEVVLWWLWDK